jgi:serralysin
VFDTPPKSNNIDRIMAFVVADDTIALDDAVFTALKDPSLSTPHGLAQGAFYVGSRAHDADDRIIYNASTRALSYDVDGSGRGGAVQFATFDPKVSGLSFSDFEVI